MENIMNRVNTAEFKKNYEVSSEIFYKKVAAIEEELNLQDQMTDEARLYLELVKNEEALKELASLQTKEEVKALFLKHGLDFSDEEIDQLLADIGKSVHSLIENNGELTEDELEMIAGGGFGSWIKGRFSSVGKALITVGTAVMLVAAVVVTGGTAIAAIASGTIAAGFTAAAGGIAAGAGAGIYMAGDIIEGGKE